MKCLFPCLVASPPPSSKPGHGSEQHGSSWPVRAGVWCSRPAAACAAVPLSLSLSRQSCPLTAPHCSREKLPRLPLAAQANVFAFSRGAIYLPTIKRATTTSSTRERRTRTCLFCFDLSFKLPSEPSSDSAARTSSTADRPPVRLPCAGAPAAAAAVPLLARAPPPLVGAIFRAQAFPDGDRSSAERVKRSPVASRM